MVFGPYEFKEYCVDHVVFTFIGFYLEIFVLLLQHMMVH